MNIKPGLKQEIFKEINNMPDQVFKSPMAQANALQEQAHKEPYNLNLKRVKGASPEFIAKTNKEYEEVVPFLKEQGYNLDNVDSVAFEKYMDELFAKIDADQELQGLYKAGKHNEGNTLYNERYGKLFNALDKGWNKHATDEFAKQAPYGYEDEVEDFGDIDADYERSYGPVDTKEKYMAYQKWLREGN